MNNFSIYAQWAGSFIIFLSYLPSFKYRKPYIKALLFYSIMSIVFQLAQQVSMSFFNSQSVNQIGNGFVFFEASFLSLVFILASESGRLKKVFFTLFILYVAWYVVAFFFFNENMYSVIRTGRDLLMILNSILFFYYLLRNLPEDDLLKFPMFWINSATLFFFSGTFILSIFRDYIVFVLENDMNGFWTFRNFFRFAFCLVLAYAGWLNWRSIKLKETGVR